MIFYYNTFKFKVALIEKNMLFIFKRSINEIKKLANTAFMTKQTKTF